MNTVSNAIPHSPSRRWPRLRRFAVDVAITQVFNLVIALVVTYILQLNNSLFQNIVVSICIGTTMVAIIDGGRLLLWGLDRPPRLPFILLFLVALPCSQYIGKLLASGLLDIPAAAISAARARNSLGFYVMFLLGCMAVTWFFWKRGQIEQLTAQAEAEKARAAAIEKQAMQAQLQALQAQIEPHMLFNTLANLQALIAVDTPRAQQMLDQLIQYLRGTLSTSRSRQTTLAQEFALMQAYLGLMQVRMGERLSFALHLPDALRDLPLPPMLLQPLVENAIRHGLEPKLEGGRIEVDAARDGRMLILRVSDDGLGHDADASTAGTRTAIANVRERLQALFGAEASFSMEANRPRGMVASMRIPL